jgi:hypothetical protein
MPNNSIQEMTLEELEYQRKVAKIFSDLASVGIDTETMRIDYNEFIRQLDAEILERTLLSSIDES